MIELVLVMALLGVVATVVAFSSGTSIRWRTLNRDGTGIYSVCAYARSIAIAQSKRTRLEVDTVNRQYKLTIEEDPDAAVDVFTVPVGTWSEIFTYDDAVTVTLTDRKSGDATLLYVTFYPDGMADPVDVDIVHETFREFLRISVNDLTALATLETIDEER